MATLSQGHPRARTRAPRPTDLDKVDPQRSVAMFRERFRQRVRDDVRARRAALPLADVKPLRRAVLGGLPGVAAAVAIPRHRPALSFRAHRPHAADGLRQQRRDHHLHRRAPLLPRRGAQAGGADRGAAPARHRPHPRGARHRLLARRRQPVHQSAGRGVRPAIRDRLCAGSGAGGRARDRRDHQRARSHRDPRPGSSRRSPAPGSTSTTRARRPTSTGRIGSAPVRST